MICRVPLLQAAALCEHMELQDERTAEGPGEGCGSRSLRRPQCLNGSGPKAARADRRIKWRTEGADPEFGRIPPRCLPRIHAVPCEHTAACRSKDRRQVQLRSPADSITILPLSFSMCSVPRTTSPGPAPASAGYSAST